MNIVCRSVALVLGLFPLVLGCVAPAPGPLDPGGAPGLRPAEIKPGAGGTNGLDCDLYHDHELELVQATNAALTTPGTDDVSADVLATGLVATPEGVSVLGYAVKCALPVGAQVNVGASVLHGNGYLATTAGWPDAPLSMAARNDLLACVIAHVNSTVGVPLLLSGKTVIDDGGAHSDFDVSEALWRVEVTGGVPAYNVWPMAPFAAACEADPWEALNQRICGPHPEGCNFIARHDFKTACAKVPGTSTFFCDGMPVLETTLKSADVDVLHPLCAGRPGP